MRKLFLAALAPIFVCPLFADNVLHPGSPVLDRPTLTVLGVQLPLTGDDNFNAAVTVRYRVTGNTAWKQALPLFRVYPESTAGYTVAPQFAGSIFNLQPATSYDIELHATDPDGPVDQTFTVTATTRAVPGNPATPNVRNVNSTASLSAALGSAKPGDIIQLADGIYSGTFYVSGSGAPQNPIVIRGSSEEGTILDGGNCVPCNVFEVYGSYVHVENLSLRNAERALRFQGFGSTANVVRRVHIKNTTLGIGSQGNETDYYIADNILEGRLTWPSVYADDNGAHASDDGINMQGFGHVVAHNQISGYGDAMKTSQTGARSNDFYGNEILYSYDNGIELDNSEGNTRCFRNRFTNTWDALSVQPILGGPAYLFRNVVVNSADEQMKFHAQGANQEPNGVLSYNNTFVSPAHDLNLCTPSPSHHFWIENNLFVGPAALQGQAVIWCGPIDDGHFDYDGYWPDGDFMFNNLPAAGGGYVYGNFANFAAAQAGGLEAHGLVLNGLIFANGLIGPSSYKTQMQPQDLTLASGSPALNRALVLPNINDSFTGAAPDLGALESGCPAPVYGPRPSGMDETNEPVGCASTTAPTVAVTISPTSATVTAGHSQTFSASVTGAGDTGVKWTISPNTGIISNGLYTAPAAVASTQTVTVTATSNADSTKSASATVTLQPAPAPPVNISVAISPGMPSLNPGQTQQFAATVKGTSSTAVTWQIRPQLGQITSSGLFTAPLSVSALTIVTVTATSVANTAVSSSTGIFLRPGTASTPTPAPTPVAVTLTPPAVTLHAAQSQTFTPSVKNTANTAVTWSLNPAIGSVVNGVYAAPSSVTTQQTVTLTATSLADATKSASATITLTPAFTMYVTPPGMTLGPRQTQQYTPHVAGVSNTAVTWSIRPALGAISNTGLYTAPANITGIQAITVTATSVANPAASTSTFAILRP